MSKAAAIAATGVGGGGAAVGGYLIFRNGGSGEATAEPNKTEAQEEKISNELSTTLEQFKTAKGGSCGKYVFGDALTLSSGGTAIDTGDNKIQDNHFTDSDNSKSCLVINWEKTSSSETNGKWKGDFRWAWAFTDGTKGFIMFTTTKLSSAEKQLDLEGGIYFVKKEDNTSNWVIEKYATLTSKNITSTTWKDMFLQKSADASANPQIKEFGGFMTEATELNNVCKDSDKDTCITGTSQTKNFKGSWSWTKGGDGAEKLNKWCSNLETCFSKMYETQSINFTKLLESFSGTWKAETVTQPEAS